MTTHAAACLTTLTAAVGEDPGLAHLGEEPRRTLLRAVADRVCEQLTSPGVVHAVHEVLTTHALTRDLSAEVRGRLLALATDALGASD